MARSEGEGKGCGTDAKHPAHPPFIGVSLGKEWGPKGGSGKKSYGKGLAHPPSIGASLGKEEGTKGSTSKVSFGKGTAHSLNIGFSLGKEGDLKGSNAWVSDGKGYHGECSIEDHGRHMEGRSLQEEMVPEEELRRRGTSAEAVDIRAAEASRPQHQYDHLRLECVADRDDLTRAADAMQAVDHPQESTAPAMGSRPQAGVIPGEKRIWEEVLAPIAELISLKKSDMEEAKLAAEALSNFLAGGDGNEDYKQVQSEGAKLGQTLEEAIKKRRASAGHVADYTDEWYLLPEKKAGFRTFYLCGRERGTERCHTLTVSSRWHRLYQDPFASGQRWHCPACLAKYEPANGVMVEVLSRRGAYYIKAPFPPDDIIDLKAMAVEKYHAGAQTPEELWNVLPEAHPLGTNIFVATRCKGTYSYREAAFENAPSLDWNRIYKAV